MSRWRCLLGGLAWALLAATAGAPIASCGGASAAGASEPGDGDLETPPDAECCCQRYNEDGDPTGAVNSDQMACKSTGGTCTEDVSQCAEE